MQNKGVLPQIWKGGMVQSLGTRTPSPRSVCGTSETWSSFCRGSLCPPRQGLTEWLLLDETFKGHLFQPLAMSRDTFNEIRTCLRTRFVMESSNPRSLLSLPFNLAEAQGSLGRLCHVVSQWGRWVPEQGRVCFMPDFHQMGSVGQIPSQNQSHWKRSPFLTLTTPHSC